MALLGADFNASRPTDGDYGQRESGESGATVLRDVRSRLKTFFATMFDLDTGRFKRGSIPSSALASLSPTPAGTYQQVTVNPRGLVTAGSAAGLSPHPRPFRAYFLPDGTGFYETEDGAESLTSGSEEETPSDKIYVGAGLTTYFGFREFMWPVPAGIAAVRAYLVGGGQAGRSSKTGNAGAVCWVDFPVHSSPAVSIIVGLGGALTGRVGGHSQIRQVTDSDDRWVNTKTHLDADGDWAAANIGFPFRSSTESETVWELEEPYRQPLWYPYGKGGDVGAVGTGGIVVLEWYA